MCVDIFIYIQVMTGDFDQVKKAAEEEDAKRPHIYVCIYICTSIFINLYIYIYILKYVY